MGPMLGEGKWSGRSIAQLGIAGTRGPWSRDESHLLEKAGRSTGLTTVLGKTNPEWVLEFDTPEEEMGNAGRSRPTPHHAFEHS